MSIYRWLLRRIHGVLGHWPTVELRDGYGVCSCDEVVVEVYGGDWETLRGRPDIVARLTAALTEANNA